MECDPDGAYDSRHDRLYRRGNGSGQRSTTYTVQIPAYDLLTSHGRKIDHLTEPHVVRGCGAGPRANRLTGHCNTANELPRLESLTRSHTFREEPGSGSLSLTYNLPKKAAMEYAERSTGRYRKKIKGITSAASCGRTVAVDRGQGLLRGSRLSATTGLGDLGPAARRNRERSGKKSSGGRPLRPASPLQRSE